MKLLKLFSNIIEGGKHMVPEIRKRRIEDSNELAHAIVTIWNTTYKGIVSDEFLKDLLNNETVIAKNLRKSINEQPYYYVLISQDKIIGWIYFTLDSKNLREAAEIHSLYILKEYQGKGYGKLLYKYAIDIILKNNLKKVVIGCLDGNPSNEFYKHLGGTYIGNHLFREKYLENLYLFEL